MLRTYVRNNVPVERAFPLPITYVPVICGEGYVTYVPTSGCRGGVSDGGEEMGGDVPGMSANGFWSKSAIAASRPTGPALVKVVETGIPQKVLRWQVYRHRPKVLHVLQEARNLQGHVQRPVSEAQVLERLHAEAAAAMAQGADPNWHRIRRTTLRSRPPCQDIVDDLIRVCVCKSGGADGEPLKEYAAFMAAFAGAVRNPGPLYAACAGLQQLHVPWAVLKANATCGDEHVKEGKVARLVAPALVNRLSVGVPKELAIKAESILLESRTLLAASGITGKVHENKQLLIIFGFLDVSVALATLNLDPPSKVAPSLRQLVKAKEFVDRLKKAYPNCTQSTFLDVWEPRYQAELKLVTSTEGPEAAAPRGQQTERALDEHAQPRIQYTYVPLMLVCVHVHALLGGGSSPGQIGERRA